MKKNFWTVLSVCVLLFLIGCVGPSGTLSANELAAEDLFTLNDLEGNPTALADVLKQNKAILLNFWASWCSPCREEIPDFIRIQKFYSGKGFTILGVNVGESQKKVSGAVQKLGINYPVLLDEEMTVAQNYHVVGIPTSYLISSDGKVLGAYHSYSEELAEDIRKALK